MKRKFRCVIWGGYAWGNTGDELCLAAALEQVRSEFGDSVAILTHRPEYTAQLFPKMAVVPYVPPDRQKNRWLKNPLRETRHFFMTVGRHHFPRANIVRPDLAWIHLVGQSERLHLAGGGYLSDLFQLDMLMPPIEFAADLKLPVTTGALGLGPFTSRIWANKVARVLSGAELKVRDRDSLDFCQRHALKAVLEPDDAFALVRNLQPVILDKTESPRPIKIGVCIFPQYGRPGNCDVSAWWTDCLRKLKTQQLQVVIEGFCFHTSPREEFSDMTRLFPLAGLSVRQVQPPIMDFIEATRAVQKYDFIIAARFHAVVVANVFKIPNIAIASGEYYQAKMRAAASGYEAFCRVADPKDFSPDEFVDLCLEKMTGLRRNPNSGQSK